MDDPKAASSYAKACRECATTKAKCIRPANGLKCERCTRLKKECRARVNAARRPRPRKPNRLTQMEEKLDGLVTLLGASQPQLQSSATSDSLPLLTPNSLSPDTRTCEFGPIQIQSASDVPLEERTKICMCSVTGIPEGALKDRVGHVAGLTAPEPRCHDLPGEKHLIVLDLTDEVATMLLLNYQTLMAKYFPFVVIPPNTTAQHLRVWKPFLFLSVMVVSYYQKTGQRTTLSAEIMSRLGDQMLVKGKKSLDLLQGALVYAQWYHSHRIMDPQLSNIMQLSIALLIDLGLNKAPHASDKYQMVTDTAKLIHGSSAHTQVRTNDERRAFLGCFYLTSVIASCFKKSEALRFNAHTEESYNALSQNPDYEGDKYLVQLVRLQQIAEKISQTLPCDAPQSFWASNPPIALLIKAFQAELQSFKESLPENLQQDPSMLQHIHCTNMHLLEISLCDWSRHTPTAAAAAAAATIITATTPSLTGTSSTARLSALHALLLATRTFLTAFLAQPTPHYSAFPFSTWGRVLNGLQVLSKLSLLADVAGWDLAHVRGVVDFSRVLDALVERFEEARGAEERVGRGRGAEVEVEVGLLEGEGPRVRMVVGSRYEMYTLRIRCVKAWFEAKLAGGGSAAAGGQAGEGDGGGRGGQTMDGEEDGERDGDGNLTANVGSTQADPIGDDFMTGNSMLDDWDAAYWHDFLEEWGSF